jgi:hypothetical protein
MTRAHLFALAAAAAAVAPSVAGAQVPVRVRAAGFYESYSFDPGLPFSKVTEIAVPVGIDIGLGRFANLALSSGFVTIDLESAETGFADQSLSGILDTELRLGINLIPGRLIALVSGAIPTGIKSVEADEVAVLAALSSDVIGFAVPSVGSGGTVGGGLVGAVPLGGRFALGLGATYSYPVSYQPIVGETVKVRPGAEIRGRAGLEGPLGRTTYLRVAGVLARRAKDQFAGSVQNGVGTRLIGYLEVAQGFGNSQLTIYGYDVYRGSPQLEATAVGQAVLPKGNLLVGGLRFRLPVTPRFSVAPRAEYRYSAQASGSFADADGDGVQEYSEGSVEKAGTSLRFGLDLRQQFSEMFALVASGGAVTGNVLRGTDEIGLSGYRFGLVFEVTR